MEPGSVRIICTDRRTHPSRLLAEFDVEEDEPMHLACLASYPGDEAAALDAYERWQVRPVTRRGGKRGEVHAARVDEVVDGQMRWRLRCPTCRRDVPLRAETLVAVVRQALDRSPTRRSTLELSELGATMR